MYFYTKPHYIKAALPEMYLISYAKLPDLIYTEYEWSEDDEWFQKSHAERLDLLRGQANTIHPSEVIVLISLNDDDIRYSGLF